jgi:hypothetical protein
VWWCTPVISILGDIDHRLRRPQAKSKRPFWKITLKTGLEALLKWYICLTTPGPEFNPQYHQKKKKKKKKNQHLFSTVAAKAG